MAFSKSLQKAQGILTCQLCDVDNRIKWKCIDCKLLLCTKCRETVHPKFKKANEHNVIDLKELGSQSDQKLDFTDIKCKQHIGHKCCIYCMSCDIPVCPMCITQTHARHTYKEFNEAYKTKLETLKTGQKQIESDKINFSKAAMLNDLVTTTDMSRFFDEIHDVCKRLTEISINKKKSTQGQEESSTQYGEPKVVKVFETGFNYIQYLFVCSDNSLWLGDDTSKLLQKVHMERDAVKPVSTYNTSLGDMVVTVSGDLLFSDSGPTLKKIDGKTGELSSTVYSVAPLLIKSFHMTSNNDIIIGAITDTAGKPLYPATGRRAIIVMDVSGKQRAVYEYDSKSERLITYPRSISTTSTGIIGIVDRQSIEYKGRVVLLKDGDIRAVYYGQQNTNTTTKTFQPRTIKNTPADNFVIADWNTNTLHIVDDLGTSITCLDIGIEYPLALCFSSSGQLFVGCSPPLRSHLKAKLYEVAFSQY